MSITCDDAVVISVVLGDPEDPTLVLPPDCDDGGIWWNDMDEPSFDLRNTFAPPSIYVPGQVLLASVEDMGALPVRIAVQGETLEQLLLRRQTVADALRAWPGTLTLTASVNGGEPVIIGGPWQTFPTTPRWGNVDPDLWGMLVCETAVSLPVNPPGAP